MTRKFRSQYDHESDLVSPGLDCSADGHGRTKQSHKAECDINGIMKAWNYGQGRPITHLNSNTPKYEDFGNVMDYTTAREAIAEAELAFSELPSAMRKHFDNDPSKLLAFVEDPDNLAEAVELGLLDEAAEQGEEPPEPETPTPVVETPPITGPIVPTGGE